MKKMRYKENKTIQKTKDQRSKNKEMNKNKNIKENEHAWLPQLTIASIVGITPSNTLLQNSNRVVHLYIK